MNLRALALFAAAVLPACIASNPVQPADRQVVAEVDSLPFATAKGLELAGLYRSVDIRGDMALSLRRIWYWFRTDGTYTAAALVEGDTVAFQTRDGTWKLGDDGLSLDGEAPVPVEVAGDHVRLSSAAGSIVLQKERLS